LFDILRVQEIDINPKRHLNDLPCATFVFYISRLPKYYENHLLMNANNG